MRAFFLLVIALLIGVEGSAQEDKARAWALQSAYGNIGGISQYSLSNHGLKSNVDVGLGVTVAAANGAGGSLQLRACSFRARNTPADYDKGSTWNLFGDDEPLESASMASLSAVYKWSPLRKPILRLSAEAGPALVVYDRAFFSPRPVTTSSGLFGSRSTNYSIEKRNETHPGFNAALRIEALLTRHVGVSFGVWKVFNGALNLTGSETSLLIGVLRQKAIMQADK